MQFVLIKNKNAVKGVLGKGPFTQNKKVGANVMEAMQREVTNVSMLDRKSVV